MSDGGWKWGWDWIKTIWAFDPRYRGPVLIRGKRLDGGSAMRFFLIPHRVLGTPWDAALLLALGALVFTPELVRRGWVRRWFPIAGAANRQQRRTMGPCATQ